MNQPEDGYDVVAVAFQEIVPLNTKSFVLEHNAVKPWEVAMHRHLPDFDLLLSKHLVGMALVVYVRKKLMPNVSAVAFCNVGVGVMGVGGNKGSVSIRFNIYDSSVCFICSHLAAKKANVSSISSFFDFPGRTHTCTLAHTHAKTYCCAPYQYFYFRSYHIAGGRPQQ